MDHSTRRYTSDEVSSIVRRALAGSGGDDIGHDDLAEIARQSGISLERLDAAIEEEEREGELDKAREMWKKRQKQEFFGHFRAYLIVNGILLLMDFFVPGPMWAQWPIMGWGIGLAFHASAAFYPSDKDIEKGARRILARRHRQELKTAYKESYKEY